MHIGYARILHILMHTHPHTYTNTHKHTYNHTNTNSYNAHTSGWNDQILRGLTYRSPVVLNYNKYNY